LNGRVAWPLAFIFVGLALTSCALALQAIVTFPTAILAAVAGTGALFPPKDGVVLWHYLGLALLGVISALITFFWQRALS
jgi:hypothetical protein